MSNKITVDKSAIKTKKGIKDKKTTHSKKEKVNFRYNSIGKTSIPAMNYFQESKFFLDDIYKDIDRLASHHIDRVIEDGASFANLNIIEKMYVYDYFYRNNPIVARSIDIHTDLPLSKLKINPPKGIKSNILKDYIKYYYESVLERLDIFSFIRDFIRQYRIQGEAFAFVQDSYNLDAPAGRKELESFEKIQMKMSAEKKDISPELKKELQEIEDRYNADSSEVSLTDRLKYIQTYFPNFDDDYTGFDKIEVVKYFRIHQITKNCTTGTYALDIYYDKNIKEELGKIDYNDETIDQTEAEQDIMENLKVSKSLLDILKNTTGRTFQIEDNPYMKDKNSSYTFSVGEWRDSLINRILSACFEWEATQAARRTRIDLIGKTGRIVSAEGASTDMLDDLQISLDQLSEIPDGSITTNYPVEINELGQIAKDDLKDLIADSDKLKDDIALGLGVPQSILSGEQQYSGSVISLELMNNEYLNFKAVLAKVLEDNIFKPLAVRKGFYTANEWGEMELIYPKVVFTRTSLRSESQYDVIYNLFSSGKIPASIVYELLNFEKETVEKGLQEDLFSVTNTNFNELLQNIYQNASSTLSDDPIILEKFKELLFLNKQGEQKEGTQEESYNIKQNTTSDSSKLYDLKHKFNKK